MSKRLNRVKYRSDTGLKTSIRTRIRNDNTRRDISILSYNISWESMSGAKKDWQLCSNNTNPKNPNHSSVCVSNIAKVINENPVDFITLQEATDYEKLLKECPILGKMKYIVHNSGLDVIITFWDSKYKMIKTVKGEFEKGRPWMATIFSNGICLINVHFGHYDSHDEYKHLENIIKKIKQKCNIFKSTRQTITNLSKKKLYDNMISRFIISGDFNYDIKNFGDKKGIIILDDVRFYHNPKHMLTCCISRRRHYDHVIDTYHSPLKITIPEVNYMASDHKPIIARLHNKQ
jgi:endonuclease/exonuclease/phosphatase family metal-dependent hydrolase